MQIRMLRVLQLETWFYSRIDHLFLLSFSCDHSANFSFCSLKRRFYVRTENSYALNCTREEKHAPDSKRELGREHVWNTHIKRNAAIPIWSHWREHTWLDDKCTAARAPWNSRVGVVRVRGNLKCVLFHSSPLAFIITPYSIHSRESEWKRLARHGARTKNRQQVKWMATIEWQHGNNTNTELIYQYFTKQSVALLQKWRMKVLLTPSNAPPPKQTHSDEWMKSNVRNLPDSSSIKSEMARLNR